jgi:hypothetical protein
VKDSILARFHIGSGYEGVLFGYEVGDFGVINEVGFVCGGGLPFGGLAGCEEVFYGVEPEFCYAVVGWGVFVTGDVDAVALDEFAEAGNIGAEGTVDLFPVAKEFIVGYLRFLRNAINEFDHLISARGVLPCGARPAALLWLILL